jgi:hypothetical protein
MSASLADCVERRKSLLALEFAMPFSGDCHSFDSSTLKELNGEGAVYGLFKTDLPFRPDHYTCLYVGQTSDLRTAMLEAYDNAHSCASST